MLLDILVDVWENFFRARVARVYFQKYQVQEHGIKHRGNISVNFCVENLYVDISGA